MRILSYEIKPAIALKFEKDGADNFYVRSDEPSATGTYRLVFLADADAGYFAPALPPDAATRVREVAAIARRPSSSRRSRRACVARRAASRCDKLGVDRRHGARRRVQQARRLLPRVPGRSRLAAVDRRHLSRPLRQPGRRVPPPLVRVHDHRERARHPDALRRERGARVRRGVVPASAAGSASISAAPRSSMDVTGANNKTLHRPRAEDPFAKPPEYKQNYTQLEGDIAASPTSSSPTSARPLDSRDRRAARSTAPATAAARRQRRPTAAIGSRPIRRCRRVHARSEEADAAPRDHDRRRERVSRRPRSTSRASRAPTASRSPTTASTSSSRRPASTASTRRSSAPRFTSADGSFRVDLTVPATLALQSYEIYLSSPEDAYYNGALTTE